VEEAVFFKVGDDPKFLRKDKKNSPLNRGLEATDKRVCERKGGRKRDGRESEREKEKEKREEREKEKGKREQRERERKDIGEREREKEKGKREERDRERKKIDKEKIKRAYKRVCRRKIEFV